MKEELQLIKKQVIEEMGNITDETVLYQIKSKYIGKSSKIMSYLSNLKNMSDEEKREYGPLLNTLRKDIEVIINKIEEDLSKNVSYDFDKTLPVYKELGSLHPITIVSKEVTDILKRMGFTVVLGPEMESDYYNFEALNIPKNHPARDIQDTYWLSNNMLLRTHTSTNQVRALQKYGVPLRVCAPGRCFRNEDIDSSHDNTFFQLEGLVVDKNISISNLIFVIKGFLREVFKQDLEVRLRPGYFPFTEPSFELDCSCVICGGAGCATCKQTGWIELCPCGMIHPNVLEESGVDSTEYNGFAFGLGLARLAMMKYKIKDIRVLNSGDLRYLKEFK